MGQRVSSPLPASAHCPSPISGEFYVGARDFLVSAQPGGRRRKASGILSPAYWRGGSTIAQGAAAPAAEPWGKVKIVTEPRATCEGVASAGVAGDAKPQASGWQIWMRVDMQIINA